MAPYQRMKVFAGTVVVRAIRLAFAIAAAVGAARACTVFYRTVESGPDFFVKVADRGHPVAGIRLRISGVSALADQTGIAIFHNVAPGQYVVRVDHDDGVPDGINLKVSAKGARNVTLHLRWPSIPLIMVRSLRGTLEVADKRADIPSPKFKIDLLEGVSGRSIEHTESSRDGAFTFSESKPGFYFLRIEQAEAIAGQFDKISGLVAVRIARDAAEPLLNLDLGMTSCGLMYTNSEACAAPELRLKMLSGRVLDSTGGVIANADVAVISNGPKPALIAHLKTDAMGRFEFHDVASGAYRLDVTSSGFTPVRRVVHIDSHASKDALIAHLHLLGECSSVAVIGPADIE